MMERSNQVRALVASLTASDVLSDRRSNPSFSPSTEAIWMAAGRAGEGRLAAGEFSRQLRMSVAAVAVYCDMFLVSPARLIDPSNIADDSTDVVPVLFFEADGRMWADLLTAGGDLRSLRRAQRVAGVGAGTWSNRFSGVRLMDCLAPLSALWVPANGSTPVLAFEQSSRLDVAPFGGGS